MGKHLESPESKKPLNPEIYSNENFLNKWSQNVVSCQKTKAWEYSLPKDFGVQTYLEFITKRKIMKLNVNFDLYIK